MRRAIVSNVAIAVVDHERLTREFVANVMMYSVNREILVFEDFEGVSDHLKAGRALHLVISEVHLPGKSGFALLRFLKQHRPQICFVTMSANPADEIPAMSLGADAFLAKPFALKDLFAIVQRFVVESGDVLADAAVI
ncbi:MAG: response regulator [Desulfatitalea sp.]|nr:response regulator [Desulfatitalea sp.]